MLTSAVLVQRYRVRLSPLRDLRMPTEKAGEKAGVELPRRKKRSNDDRRLKGFKTLGTVQLFDLIAIREYLGPLEIHLMHTISSSYHVISRN
jgi:hypothetical protein